MVSVTMAHAVCPEGQCICLSVVTVGDTVHWLLMNCVANDNSRAGIFDSDQDFRKELIPHHTCMWENSDICIQFHVTHQTLQNNV